MKILNWLGAAIIVVSIAGCGGTGAGSSTNNQTRVVLTTPQVNLSTSGSIQLSATVTGVSNTTVEWSVLGGDANGTISPTGLYQAPSAPGVYQVLARLVADPASEARATITVGRGVNITIAPQNPTATVGSDVQFTATVTGPASSRVRYEVDAAGDGGTMTTTGLYTAPEIPGQYRVRVTSLDDPTRTATTTVSVASGIAIRQLRPAANVVTIPGGLVKFRAKVSGTSNTAVSWRVEEANGGTINQTGDYIAPSTPGTYTIRAVARADERKRFFANVVVADQVKASVRIPGKGTMVLGLNRTEAPRHVKNFVDLANDGFYDGIIFHRYEPGFVIQGGDPLTKTLPLSDSRIGTGGPGYTINFEPNSLRHTADALGMARGTDRNSAGSQWYITLAPQPSLDGDYVVFGSVIEGRWVPGTLRRGDVMESVRIEAR